MKTIGYARVSTRQQANSGNSLEEQEKVLREKGCSEVYKESYTGTKTDRPVFNEMLSILEAGDTLMVTKLDRFARTATEGVNLIRELMAKGIGVNILNMGMVEDSPIGKVTLTVMSAFAEFERDMIVERTQAGKAIAKTKAGFKEGRPKSFTDTQINHALDLLENYSYTQVAEMTKISKATLTRELRKREAELVSNVDNLYLINNYLQSNLTRGESVDAITAAKWLDEEKLLEDSVRTPGLPLRNLLRRGLIKGGRQEPNHRWFIDFVE
ncbi:recombinase family protein [Dehalobacter sp. DCM]|uniref:recombinase family protein n=1 Tax=Dehalobacter sp. DCM TaxID=2907827 RepID=UPI003081554A